MNDQSDSQNELNKVLKKIQEIVKESADGDYIYRGEPECNPKVSSNLYREYEKEIEDDSFDIKVVQQGILNEAREYISETASDIEVLTELQHHGGKTNLIDFTADYLVALFFASDEFHDKPGRLVLLEKQSEVYEVMQPVKLINRVTTQKSIFVQADTGFINSREYKVIYIPEHLKTYMLDYLQKHHDISTKTIYNDLQGFIDNRRIHRSAYTEFYRGLTCQKRGDVAETFKEKHDHYGTAIKYYSEALKLNPQMFEAYHNRGIVYSEKEEYDEALQDLSTTIENNPNDAKAYYNRGVVYLRRTEYDKALHDFNTTIENNPNDAKTYRNRGLIYIIKDEPDMATQDFSKAIELEPDNPEAYVYRGGTYLITSEPDKATQDFSKAIELEPDNSEAYCNRGEAWLHLKEWEKARMDLTFAKDNGYDIITSFHNDYESVENFEQKNGFQLPEDIAVMLRQQ